jgi:hypothetical protein
MRNHLLSACAIVVGAIASSSATSQESESNGFAQIACLDGLLRMSVPVEWEVLNQEKSLGGLDRRQAELEYSFNGTCRAGMRPNSELWSVTILTVNFRRGDPPTLEDEIARLKSDNTGAYDVDSIEMLANGALYYRHMPKRVSSADLSAAQGATRYVWELCTYRKSRAARCAHFVYFADNEEVNRESNRKLWDALDHAIRSAELERP